MRNLIIKVLNISAVIFSFSPLFVHGDDTEIYLGSNLDRQKSLANIIFIMDTSGSMGANVDGKTRLKTVQEVANQVIEESAADPDKDFNIALMSFNGSNGANVDMPMTPLSEATTTFKTKMNGYSAGGNTPITESLDEALRYLRGDTPLYGTSSIASSKQAGSYKSPITDECQTNHIVLFSDGAPTSDEGSNASILTDFNLLAHPRKESLITDSNVQQCAQDQLKYFHKGTNPPNSFQQNGITYTYSHQYPGYPAWHYYTHPVVGGSGYCAEELALIGQLTDLAPSSDLPGIQSATFHTVGGFATSGSATLTKLQNIARYGTPLKDDGSEQYKSNLIDPLNYYAASNASGLKSQLTALFGKIIKNDSTFTAPAVSVNAYNRLQHKDELYYSVFSPEKNANWKGNLKRYRLGSDTIFDKNNKNAVNAETGFFSDTSHSFWTEGDHDGKAVDKGGIASRFRLPADLSSTNGRMVTTFLGDKDLINPSNRIHPDNNSLDNSLLALDSSTTNTERKELISWASGIDVNNEDEDTDPETFDDPRPFMEDPLHSQPVIINYSADESVVFISTNSGYLHAFSPKLDDGTERPKELFSFIPKELLKNIKPYYSADEGKEYGLDGPLSYYHNDLYPDGLLRDPTGKIQSVEIDGKEVKESIHIYASMRRGGRNYYALDVTSPESPSYLWQINGGEGKFAKLGQTWSKMIPAKIYWEGEETNVLFFGGGYDRDTEDCLGSGSSLNCAAGPVRRAETAMGNAIFMVNANTGEYLWSASNKNAQLNLPEMTSSIVSDLTVIDTNSDGLADLIYSSDTGGRIWRIDLNNKPATGDSMVAAGGLIADMNEDSSNNIRFYNTIDVAYISAGVSGVEKHFQLSIGSGYRAHPLDKAVRNRFYLINDFHITEKPYDDDQDADKFYETITESDLLNTTAGNISTTDKSNQKGMYYILANAGEKVLARSITVDNTVFFTTYRPNDGLASTSCEPNVGFAKLYRMSPKPGGLDTADNVSVTGDDLGQTGIPPQPIVLYPPPPESDPGPDPDPTKAPPKASCAGQPIIIIGAEIVPSELKCEGQLKKTYWKVN